MALRGFTAWGWRSQRTMFCGVFGITQSVGVASSNDLDLQGRAGVCGVGRADRVHISEKHRQGEDRKSVPAAAMKPSRASHAGRAETA